MRLMLCLLIVVFSFSSFAEEITAYDFGMQNLKIMKDNLLALKKHQEGSHKLALKFLKLSLEQGTSFDDYREEEGDKEDAFYKLEKKMHQRMLKAIQEDRDRVRKTEAKLLQTAKELQYIDKCQGWLQKARKEYEEKGLIIRELKLQNGSRINLVKLTDEMLEEALEHEMASRAFIPEYNDLFQLVFPLTQVLLVSCRPVEKFILPIYISYEGQIWQFAKAAYRDGKSFRSKMDPYISLSYMKRN